MESDRILPGVALMLGFCLTAPLIDVASKLAAVTVPVGEITAARFLVQAAIMAPIVAVLGHSLRLPRALAPMVALRALFLILSTFSFVSALTVMPLADALAIAFVEPFLLLLLGAVLFGDAVGPRRIVASIAGFLGALLCIQPSLAVFGSVAFWPLGTALFFALYMLATRRLSRQGMQPVPMQFQTAFLALLMCVPVLVLSEGSGIAALDPLWPTGLAWVWLAGVGVASAASHMLMTYALRFAPSATLAPLHYLEIVSAATLGYLVFGDFPDLLTWTGIAVIVVSGLYIVHRERMQARAGSVLIRGVEPDPPVA